MSGSVGLLHARGGLCGCLRLQDEHEAPQRRRPKAWVERERNRRSQIPSSRTRERAGSCLLPVVRVVHPRPQFTVRYRSWASECPMSRAIRCTRRSASQPVWWGDYPKGVDLTRSSFVMHPRVGGSTGIRYGGTAAHRAQVQNIPLHPRGPPRDQSHRCSLRLRRWGNG